MRLQQGGKGAARLQTTFRKVAVLLRSWAASGLRKGGKGGGGLEKVQAAQRLTVWEL